MDIEERFPRVFKILIRFSTKSKFLDFHDEKDASERSYLVARLEMEDTHTLKQEHK